MPNKGKNWEELVNDGEQYGGKDKDYSPNQKTIIENCLAKAYEIGSTNPPILGDLRTALQQFAGQDDEDVNLATSMAKDLALWTEGTYGRLFNRPSTFDAKARFIVFDLNKMSQEALKPVMLLIIKGAIHTKLANKLLRKIIGMDECWKFLSMPMGAAIATELYKTGRRFNAAIGVITQSAEDLLRSPAATAISENSTVKWVLNLGGGYDKLHELKLSTEEIKAIRALGQNPERKKYRLIFLRFGNRMLIIRNMVSPRAYWTYTTTPDDLRCVLELKAKEPKLSPLQVRNVLGDLKEAHPNWGPQEFSLAIAAGRY